jgi:hypothetical protein
MFKFYLVWIVELPRVLSILYFLLAILSPQVTIKVRCVCILAPP